jgi:hypothetical protein
MQAFSPVDTKGAAMNKLSTWKMRSGTPASTHIATMNNYISRAEITDFETKKTFLIQSLDNDLVTGLSSGKRVFAILAFIAISAIMTVMTVMIGINWINCYNISK